MDKHKMEYLYKKIGQQLNLIIPETWDKVLLYSEVTVIEPIFTTTPIKKRHLFIA